jgi:hypothetical protein
MLKVGKYNWSLNGDCKQPEVPGYKTIIVMTKTSEYGSLSPFVLKDDKGRIMENIWQGSKLYPKVPRVDIPFSEKYRRIVWTWPEEIHVDANEKITDAYWKWRSALMMNPYPVRYPVGKSARHTCKCAVLIKDESTEDYECLDYIESRKRIYLPLYTDLVRKTNDFIKLKQRYDKGENLLIVEIDGPHYESMNYYKKNYNVSNDFISTDNIVDATVDNLKILLNDSKYPFGHGYCLAAAIGDFSDQLLM